jgi:hypothetical protein
MAAAASSHGIAGAVVLNLALHTVDAIVGRYTGQVDDRLARCFSSAELVSDPGIDVAATISQASQVAAAAGATKPRDGGRGGW